jgi:hypothetical protein
VDGPILTLPPLVVDESSLKGTPSDADVGSAFTKAFDAALGEQAAMLEQFAEPETQRVQQSWQWLKPRLLATAGVDEKTFDSEVGAFGAQLETILQLPPKERAPALQAAEKDVPGTLRSVSAAISKGKLPDPGTSVLLMGTAELFGGLDSDAFAILLAWLRSQQAAAATCQTQTLLPPYPIASGYGLDPTDDVLDPSVGFFRIGVQGGLASIAHKAVVLGAPFTVRDSDIHVDVTVTLTNQGPAGPYVASGSSAGVVGAGYLHAWSQLILTLRSVDDPAVTLDSMRIEPRNVMVIVGYDNEATQPGELETHTLTCSFPRSPGDFIHYVATVQAITDITIVGLPSVWCELSFWMPEIQVESCPPG